MPDLTLSQLAAGSDAVVESFAPGMTTQVRRRLRAYGLSEESTVHVVRQRPVTVVRVGNAELAMERDVADRIVVRRLDA